MIEKLCLEAALAEIKTWGQLLGADIGTPSDGVVASVMGGLVTLDEPSRTFTVSLRSPVRLENGQELGSLKISEPDGRQLREAMRGENKMDMSMRILSAVSGQPLGVIERLKQRDLTLAGELMVFFA